MSITFDFGHEVIVLPKGAVEDNLQNASREELCVLLSAAAQPSLTAREPGEGARHIGARGHSRADLLARRRSDFVRKEELSG